MAKKSIWEDQPSRYGTYEGPKGNPSEWAANFSFVFDHSPTIQSLSLSSDYSILGLQPTATEEQVKNAYRRLAREHHSDTGDGNTELFVKITEAYQRLRNKFHPTTPTSPRTPHRPAPPPPTDADLIIPQLLTEIGEEELENYLSNPEFGAQEKKDGRHLTLEIKNGIFKVRNKLGVASTNGLEFERELRELQCDILLDGEQIGDKFHVWDILNVAGRDLRDLPYYTPEGECRYRILCQLNLNSIFKIVALSITEEEKRQLLAKLKELKKEGIVFKRLAATYTSGKGFDQFKFKFYAEASVVVVAGRPGKASIGMELFNEEGEREFVGYCTCVLNPLPSVGSIAEIKYLYAYRGGCLFQSSFKGLRDDVNLEDCSTAQLKYKAEEL